VGDSHALPFSFAELVRLGRSGVTRFKLHDVEDKNLKRPFLVILDLPFTYLLAENRWHIVLR
jgi:hypothetical protein